MKAMILAAGRGSRLSPITDTIPKPLLKIGSLSMIEHHLVNLEKAGIKDIVINLDYLGGQIRDALGDGSRYHVKITYSPEPEGALETGGGIYHALPLLGDAPFIVLNSDFYTDYPFASLPKNPTSLVHMVLVDIPEDLTEGDFAFYEGKFDSTKSRNVTFAGISVYQPQFFAHCQSGKYSVVPYLYKAVANNQASGEYFSGLWCEVGTLERWRKAQEIWGQN